MPLSIVADTAAMANVRGDLWKNMIDLSLHFITDLRERLQRASSL